MNFRKSCLYGFWTKVRNLFSAYPESIKLDQMTTINVIFHVAVSVYRLVKIWNSSQFTVNTDLTQIRTSGFLYLSLCFFILLIKPIDCFLFLTVDEFFLFISLQKFPFTRNDIRWPWAKMHNLTQWLRRWKQELFHRNTFSHTLSCQKTSSSHHCLQSIPKLEKSWSAVDSTWMKYAISYLKSRLAFGFLTLPMECSIDQPRRLYSSTSKNIRAKSRCLLRRPPII